MPAAVGDTQSRVTVTDPTAIRVAAVGVEGPASLAAGSLITAAGDMIIGTGVGTATAQNFQNAVSDIALGRTTRALYDKFSDHADGALSGVTPTEGGSTWGTTGSQPTIISGGFATSTGSGYAVQTFADVPTLMTCDVSFSGSNPATGVMTMSWCKDTLVSGTMLNNLVHLNFGPKLFTLTVRKGGGSFDTVLSGVWSSPIPMDGTVAHIEFARDGDAVAVYGPNGGVFATRDRRISDVLSGGGETVFWQPTTSATEQAFLHEASAFTTDTTGKNAAPLEPSAVAALAQFIGANGQVYGNHNGAAEVRIGLDPASNLPSITFGPTEVRTYLVANTSIGATTFQTPEMLPPSSVLAIGYGSTGETLTQDSNFASGAGAPFTSTTTGAATKAHSAGDPVTATVPAGDRCTMVFNSAAGFFYLPDKLIVVQNSAGLYFSNSLDTILQRESAGVLATNAKFHVGTEIEIDGALNHDGSTAGFYNTTPISKPTVTGSKGGNAALTSLLTQLAALGLITDSSS